MDFGVGSLPSFDWFIYPLDQVDNFQLKEDTHSKKCYGFGVVFSETVKSRTLTFVKIHVCLHVISKELHGDF